MTAPDLNLLITLDILVEESSVTRAAERLGMSAPSLSRALARIRDILGDPILVRAGRDLVPTPRALQLRERVHALVEEAVSLLRPEGPVVFDALERQFNIRANEAFTMAFAADLTSKLSARAPKITVRFAPEGESDDDALREGRIDLDIGALRAMGPEVRAQTIFRDHFVGVVRPGHPIFAEKITPERFVLFDHISASRRGRARGPLDKALGELGLERRIALIVASFQSALFVLSDSDRIASVPGQVLTAMTRLGMNLRAFPLPVPLETVVMAQAWHPRLDNDPVHRFLRGVVRDVCKEYVVSDSL